MEKLNKNQVEAYSLSEFQNTYYLGYRDVPAILKMFCQGLQAIDYGCGSGRSTRFLQQLGFTCIGLDISAEMVKEAKKQDPKGSYQLIESGKILAKDSSCDLIFSCFVFLTIPTYQELEKIFKEIARVLKSGGIFLFVTSSKYLYYKEYISYDIAGHPNLRSGDKIEVKLKDLGVGFKNYFYSDEDYRSLLKNAGLELVQYHTPLGLTTDGIKWKDESLFGPYVVYTAKK